MKITNKKVKLKEFVLSDRRLLYNSKKEGLIPLSDIVYIDSNGSHLSIYFNSSKTNKFKKLDLFDLQGGNQSFIKHLILLHSEFTGDKHSSSSTSTHNASYLPISTPNDFKEFVKHTQQDFVCNSTPSQLNTLQFNRYLQSNENSLQKPQNTTENEPLYNYYISASHNTYLFGNQLAGSSTTIGYIRSLLLGCRSVEIDVWNGDDGWPIVYHGHTLTQPIPLIDILTTINTFAFISSNLPLILSVENHCDLAQQDRMAGLFVDILGDLLITQRLQHDRDILPSPHQLRYKILFKTKNLHITSASGSSAASKVDGFDVALNSNSSDYSHSHSHSSSSDIEKSKLSNFIQKVTRRRSTASSSDRSSTASTSPTLVDSFGNLNSTTSTTSTNNTDNAVNTNNTKMSQKLLDLLIYTVGVKFRGFNKKEHYEIEHMFSLSDRSARKLINASSGEFMKHNRNHLTRIYPHGARVKSTNFDVLDYWAVGSQLLALNYQTVDLAMWLNFALFNDTGGYVLKPSPLRNKEEKRMVELKGLVRLSIKVICAQQVSKNVNRVAVEVHTPRSFNNDTCLKRFTSTANLQSHGQVEGNPTWNDTLSFDVNVRGNMIDLVVVKFDVLSSQHEEAVASYAITLAQMQLEMYRCLISNSTK
ncbi:hypothetical protein E3P89_02966 [Wallemia ichthyophaga]|uniref:Phosphoinositide phospholipase C n=1 Tax=Wallemia ichthyophaga TaxID=245174 RepID=A0A4V6TNB7_WALIC|nr:hypothetical protein E3P90_02987 [Wallemia ichthyophaga]TIB10114.1 hypothetical protein E3P93_02991 [Wallemia ichthyophaga]TIB20831.1 hypothetical protein E3P89_02966 [Wallemia ichthyophaga]TIB22604.1 hypothetical protein E3P88_02957 [Wallemia ichthyophaga]